MGGIKDNSSSIMWRHYDKPRTPIDQDRMEEYMCENLLWLFDYTLQLRQIWTMEAD